MRPVKSYIAKRFQNSDAGLSLDTDAGPVFGYH